MLLYKYKDISNENFKYTQDLFVNSRIYLPKANLLNDPNEGVGIIDIKNQHHDYGNLLEERNRQCKTKVCSFTKNYKNVVMWSHYANQHKGICIEFNFQNMSQEIKDKLVPVTYVDTVQHCEHKNVNHINFFSYKTKEWAYEEEVRYITNENEEYLNISDDMIRRVYLGARINTADIEWIKFWLKNYSKRKIELVQLKFKTMSYELIEIDKLESHEIRIV